MNESSTIMCRFMHLKWFFQCLLCVFALNAVVVVNAEAVTPMAKIKFWDDHENSSSFTVNHSAWQEVLAAYLDTKHPSGINRFDYGAVSSDDSRKLGEYLQYLQNLEPRQFNETEQKAYWINLYNATVVKLVLSRRPEDSIREVRSGVFTAGPWGIDLLRISRQKLTLDDIEHGILRPRWNDPRVHFALNCASLGCPNLAQQPYTSANMEEMLEQAARDYVNHSRGVSVSANGDLELSSIFSWYDSDFATTESGLKDYLIKYATPELVERIKRSDDVSYQYNWSLNQP